MSTATTPENAPGDEARKPEDGEKEEVEDVEEKDGQKEKDVLEDLMEEVSQMCSHSVLGTCFTEKLM